MSPAKRRTRRSARRRAKKPVRKRAGARKLKHAARKARKKSARTLKRTHAKKPGRAARKAPKKTSRRRGKLRLVRDRRPAPKRPSRAQPATPPPPAFATQTGASSAKQRILFELVRARAAVLGAIKGLTAAAAEEPLAPGKWSVRETVLHLVARDRARLREMESALLGRRVSWAGIQDPEMAAMNAADLEPLRHFDWEQALASLHTTRQDLEEALEAIPDEPGDIWSPAHPFGEMLHWLPEHDRHHAEVIKRWRIERGA